MEGSEMAAVAQIRAAVQETRQALKVCVRAAERLQQEYKTVDQQLEQALEEEQRALRRKNK